MMLIALMVSEILKKNHFVTVEAATESAAEADIDDSIKRKRVRSLFA